MRNLLLFFLVTACSFTCFSQNTLEYFKNQYAQASTNQEKLTALDSLLEKTFNGDPTIFSKYTDEFIALALSEKQYDKALGKGIKVSYINSSLLQNPSKTLTILNSLEIYKDSVSDSYLRGGLHLKRAGAYFIKSDIDKAMVDYTAALHLYTSKDSIYIADALFFRGQANFEKGNHLKAIEDYKLARTYYENLGDLDYVFYTSASIIDVYGVNGFDDKTIEARQQLIERVKKINKKNLFSLYFNQAINYKNLGDTERQEATLLTALDYLEDSEEYQGNLVRIHAALADFYLENDQMAKGNSYLEVAAAEVKPGADFTAANAYYFTSLSKYLFAQGKLDASLEQVKRILSVARSGNRGSLLEHGLSLQTDIFEAKGETKKALAAYKELKTFQDSIFSVKRGNALSYYQSLFENEQQQKEITAQEVKIELLHKDKLIAETKNKFLWAIVIGSFLLTIGSIVFVRRRAKQKRDLLQLKLDANKERLETFTQELVAKSAYIENLNAEIIKLKQEFGGNEKIDKLQELVSLKILTADHWTEFKDKFLLVYPNLLIKAREVNNELTNSEERLIALEKLNLKTQEIANILGISPESVVKLRYRLRKKLGIDKETSILSHIELSA